MATISITLNVHHYNLRSIFNELIEFLNEYQTDFKDTLNGVYVHELDRRLEKIKQNIVAACISDEGDDNDVKALQETMKRLEHGCLNRD